MATISKGHFVTAPRNREKNGVYKSLPAENWYRSYMKIWNLLKFKFEEASDEMYTTLVNDIVEYVSTLQYERNNIPLVTISTGVNSDNMLSRISNELQSRLNYVVSVPEINITSMNYFIHSIVSSFINRNDENLFDEEMDYEGKTHYSKSCRKTLRHLHEWYFESVKSLPIKSSRSNLVIIFPAIESFPEEMLKKFLKAVNVYAGRLPLVLVLGVKVGLDVAYYTATQHVVNQFSIRSFLSPQATVFLDSVLEKVFLTAECPFQISGKIFEFLTNSFLIQHFSINEFIRGIQFCLMNQFFDSDISVLCCSYEEIPKAVKSLNGALRKKLSNLPSVKKFRRMEKITDERPLDTDIIEKLLKEFHDHLSMFHVAVRCLHAFTKDLPNQSLGTHVRDIYIEAMDTDICKNSDEFKSSFSFLQHLSKDEILEKLDIMINILKTNEKNQFNEILETLYNHRKMLQESDLCKPVQSPTKSPRKMVSPITNRSDFLRSLSSNALEGKKLSQFSKTRNDFLKFLFDEFFKKFLRPPSDLPLSEIMVFSNVNMVRTSFNAFPRAALHSALMKPSSYLHCKCCVSADQNEILSSCPDLCIAYKLYLECGQHINLYDWLQSFRSIVDEDNDSADDAMKPEIHARFMQAVKELQFLGYIAPSTHKVDHVKKLAI